MVIRGKADEPCVVILDPVAEKLGRAGLARDDRILDASLAGGSRIIVNDLPHPLSHLFKLVRGDSPFLDQVGAYLDRLLFADSPVQRVDLFDKMGPVDKSAVGHSRSDNGHLERGRQHKALTDGGVGSVARTPALPGIVLGEPVRSRQHTGGHILEGQISLLSQAEQPANDINLINARGVAILEEEGVTGVLDGRAQILMSMRRHRGLGREHPALHVFISVLDTSGTVEFLGCNTGAATS